MANSTFSAIKTNPSLFERLKSFAVPIGNGIRKKLQSLLALNSPNTKPHAPFTRRAYQFNTLTINLAGAGNPVLLRVALSRLFKTPAIIALVAKAFNGAPFKVEFVAQNDIYSEGECSFISKTIRIAKEQSLTHTLSTLIFELCNASNPALVNMELNQFSSANEYALALEQAEYLSYQKHISLLRMLLSSTEFVSTLEGVGANPAILQAQIHNAFQSFEEYWQGANTLATNKDCTHSDYYRRHFEKHKSKPLIFSDRSDLSSFFISKEAKELFKMIRQNPQAFAILQGYQKPIVACLANSTTKQNLEGFKALNSSEQVCFIRKYAERKSQPLLIKKCYVNFSALH